MADATDKISFVAADEAATLRCAAWLAGALHADDYGLISLEGDLGAGKTAFARGLIQARCGRDTIVPSPSFALVQPYEDAVPPLWHVDLYRLGEAGEVDELGLLEALGTHVCLVEWAERAEEILPPALMHIGLGETDSGARHIDISGPRDKIAALRKAAAREDDLLGFLRDAGWQDARRAPLAGDASTRRYERLSEEMAHTPNTPNTPNTAILMDWAKGPDGPPIYDGKPYSQIAHLAESMPAYCRMVDWLTAHGLEAPAILARDEAAGFALMQDFGDRHIANDAQIDRAVFYHEAIANLLHLHEADAAPFLAAYDGTVQAVEAGLFLDWFLPWRGIEISDAARAGFMRFWTDTGNALAAQKRVTVLRDYHSVNLLWRTQAQARFRVGLIDVQDALAGHAAYDVSSLLCDARLDVDDTHKRAGLTHYLESRFGDDKRAHEAFLAAYAQCTAQRNFKIAGIFVRLAERDLKPTYLRHMPRIMGYLREALAHPAMAEMADWLRLYAPQALDIADD